MALTKTYLTKTATVQPQNVRTLLDTKGEFLTIKIWIFLTKFIDGNSFRFLK